ncbi:hypothetical protein LGQ03_05955 [Loktanella sp. TSTF-M6]|uniref:CBS domain-containing protein n=1 Tax=Loktanella gaetbuli TaxID=2881335 RepID=A0ABS8BSR6_9RHOB|nr:hypothetical protein [Loktanella gaetbuli]MCB5198778.1 hypothetical protein [Loktanella gaetbuli]
MTWAPNHDASIEKLWKVQNSLTVGLIMVPRQSFTTCKPSETAKDVQRRNPNNFSFFPVEHEGRIIGLYDAERWFSQAAPDTHVADDVQPLSEDILIAADASIFDFIMQADRHPTNLVVSGSQIAGLISLSDIQQLPVRAALFSAITSFEMAMALAITKRWPDPAEWAALLPEKRRERLEAEIAKGREGDTAIDEIAYTQFCDKKTLIVLSGALEMGRGKLEKALGRIERLRDPLAHANEYAGSAAKAKKVCETVRTLVELKNMIFSFLQGREKT